MTRPTIPSGGRYVGLPPEPSRQILRDFQALIQAWPGDDLFDAIIDPTRTSSDPIAHVYKNMTDLAAHETWAPHYNFLVGVKQRNAPQIVEPSSPIDISSKGDLSLFGLGPVTPDNVNTKGWDWGTLTCVSGQVVYYYNLSFMPTSLAG